MTTEPRMGADWFDQADIHAEAEAFAAFIAGALRGYGIDPARLTYLGYSNGANFLGAVLRLHPGLARRAILLRGIDVLEDAPTVDLGGTEVLLLTGRNDPFASMAPALEPALSACGAKLAAHAIDAAHDLGDSDLALARDWLAAQRSAATG